MINTAIRLFVLVALAIAAIVIMFFVIHVVLRLVILGAIAFIVIMVVRNWDRGQQG